MGCRVRRSKCKHCNDLYRKDARNAWHQQYCCKDACRKASKAASQRGWFAKKDNENHFRDADNAKRVRQWQQAHPGYWKNKKRSRSFTLQVGIVNQVEHYYARGADILGAVPMKRMNASIENHEKENYPTTQSALGFPGTPNLEGALGGCFMRDVCYSYE